MINDKTAALPEVSQLPVALQKDLRSDHAGETGAVYIYHGILAVSRDADVRAFAKEHLRTEQEHLKAFEEWLTPEQKSRLIPLWRLAGWSLGALSALGGRNGVFLTIDAVERFVVEHYAAQIAFIAEHLGSSPAHTSRTQTGDFRVNDAAWQALQAMLTQFMQEEDHHRDDAAQRAERQAGVLGRTWAAIVGSGSAHAVSVSRAL